MFSQQEIKDFEYEVDLLMQGAFGYGLPGDMGPLLGRQYTRKLVERYVFLHSLFFPFLLCCCAHDGISNINECRFATMNGSAVPMFVEFGHDTTIDLALTGLGLIKDTPIAALPTNPSHNIANPARQWRTSYQVPFAARMVWEKFSCSSSSTSGLKSRTSYVRLLLNGAPISLEPVCGKTGAGAKNTFGACALGDFVKSPAVQLALNDKTGAWHGAAWNATCGP